MLLKWNQCEGIPNKVEGERRSIYLFIVPMNNCCIFMKYYMSSVLRCLLWCDSL